MCASATTSPSSGALRDKHADCPDGPGASLPAWAASRVVISTPEPMQVFVDGMLEPTSVGSIRVAVPHIKPEHVIAIHSLSGQFSTRDDSGPRTRIYGWRSSRGCRFRSPVRLPR